MDVSTCVSDVLANVLDESNNVVVTNRLDLGDPRDIERGLLFDLGEIVDRNFSESHTSLDRQDLNFQPTGELRALREDGRHLFPGIAGNHLSTVSRHVSRFASIRGRTKVRE
jgi:hypothetical protein